MKEKTLFVSAIEEGTVIDHIEPGAALKIVQLLHLSNPTHPVTIGLGLKSRSLGKKDLIKIDQLFFNEEQCSQIALFSPHATINIIQNYAVLKKFKVQMPDHIQAILTCPNPCCIGHFEQIPTLFHVEGTDEKVLLRCKYCEKLFYKEEMSS